MEKTGIGFFIKPKFNIINISKTENDIIYTKEYNDIKLYIRKDSLFIIELKDNLENRKEEIWNINNMSGDAYGKISYNSSCWFPTSRHCVEATKLTKDTFDKVIKDFEKSMDIILDNKDAMQIILLLQKSYITMINEQVDISILMSWTVIERLINIMWEDLLNEKVYSNKRKKTILDIKEYTASIKTNELLINNKIDNTFANEIDDARKVRNKIVHGNYNMFNKKEKINSTYQIIMPLVLKEINIACKYIELYYKLKIEIGTSINSQIY